MFLFEIIPLSPPRPFAAAGIRFLVTQAGRLGCGGLVLPASGPPGVGFPSFSPLPPPRRRRRPSDDPFRPSPLRARRCLLICPPSSPAAADAVNRAARAELGEEEEEERDWHLARVRIETGGGGGDRWAAVRPPDFSKCR